MTFVDPEIIEKIHASNLGEKQSLYVIFLKSLTSN